jgi:hypothetical protein
MDFRCALSGLPITWSDKPSPVATLLLEELEPGKWSPLTPPVADHSTPHARHVGTRVDAMFKSGALTTESPEDLAAHRKPGTKGTQLEKFLAHAVSGIAKGFALKLNGHRVLPAVYLDEVATALVAAARLEQRPSVEEAFFSKRDDLSARKLYVDYLLAQNRGALADHYRTEVERGTFGAFGAPDPTFAVEGFHLVLHWTIDKRRGLAPAQPFEGDKKAPARDAWTGDEPAISKLVATVRPEWVEEWKAAGASTTAVARETKAGKAYSGSERYAVGDVVTHPSFGPGIVEELVAPNKARIRFGHELKTLLHKRG